MKKKLRKSLWYLVSLMLLASIVFTFGPVTAYAVGTTYYVSSSSGDDSNSGTSPTSPWKTLGKASRTYSAGDSILLKCGDTWNEQFSPSGDGTATNPITISSYGTGDRPVIDRQDQDDPSKYCIFIEDSAGYKIEGIELCNAYRGLYFQYSPGVTGKDYIFVDDCYFHDFINYNYQAQTWGVGFMIRPLSTSGTVLTNITLTNSVFERCCDANDFYKDFTTNAYLLKNITISNCKATEGKGCQFCVGQAENVLYDNLMVCDIGFGYYVQTGIAGSWVQNTKDITIQNSEFGNVSNGTAGVDGEAFDFEGNVQGAIVKDTLFHDTEGPGILLYTNNGNSNNINFTNCVFDTKATNTSNEVVFWNANGAQGGSAKDCRIYLRPGEGTGATSSFTVDDTNIITSENEINGDNFAISATATASSQYSGSYLAGNANDENTTTAWMSASGTSSGEWLQLDFGTSKLVNKFIVKEDASSSISRYAIQYWDSGSSSWRDCYNGMMIGSSFQMPIVPVTTQKIRINILGTSSGSPCISEFEAYNVTYDSPSGDFFKGININGSDVTINGNAWMGQTNAEADGFSISGASYWTDDITWSPSVDADTKSMLDNIAYRNSSGSINMSQTLLNGNYEVYLWMTEDYQDYHRYCDVSIEGNSVATGIGSMTNGTWKRYGPYTASVSDGSLDISLPISYTSVIIAGVEIYRVPEFFKGININGSDVTINGNAWMGQTNAEADGFSISGASYWTDDITWSPSVDADTKSMLDNIAYRNSSGSINMSQTLPNGNYEVYLWMTEDYQDYHRYCDVSIEGNSVATGIGSMTNGTWKRYGPYTASVSDGSLDISLPISYNGVIIAGVEIYRLPEFFKGININGSDVTINGNAWMGQTNAEADGFSISGASYWTDDITWSPSVDADTKSMLDNIAYRNSSGSINMSQTLPNGNYEVYLWMTEDYQDYHRYCDVSIEGNTVATGIGSMTTGTWERYGPYSASVTDGSLDISLPIGYNSVIIAGIEIWY